MQRTMKHRYGICPHCGCGCGLYLVEQDGWPSGVTASQGHPFSRGQLCARGWTCYQLVRSAARLKAPLLRSDGQLRPTDWTRALEAAGKRLREVRDRHGQGSIGIIASARLTNQEARLVRSMARDVLETPHCDSAARLGWVSAALPKPGKAADIDEADLIVVLGAGLLEENPILGARVMSRAKPAEDRPYASPDLTHSIPPAPAGLVVLDSRRSDLSDLAKPFLKAKAGREGNIMIALLGRLAELDKSGRADLAKLRETLSKIPQASLLEGSGVGQNELALAAERMAGAKRVLIIISRGLWLHEGGHQSWAAAANIAELLRGKATVLQAGANANDCGCGRILGQAGGMSYLEIIEALGKKQLRALVLIGEDPLRWLPGSEDVAKALAAAESVVVIDSFANNESSAYAEVVLPMPLTLEKTGSFDNMEGAEQHFEAAWETDGRQLEETLAGLAEYLGRKLSPGQEAKPKPVEGLVPFKAIDLAQDDGPFSLELGSVYPHLLGGELGTANTPHLSREFAGNYLELHPDDISELKLRAGWRAKVSSKAGSLVTTIKANPDLLRKTAFMPGHFGGTALAPLAYDRELKTPVLRGIGIRIEKI